MATTETETPAPEPVRIDLDAAHAAHAAEAGVGPVVVWKGAELQLPPRLPLAMLRNIGGLMRGTFLALEDTLTRLVGKEVTDQLFEELDTDDAQFLIGEVGKAYGISLGN